MAKYLRIARKLMDTTHSRLVDLLLDQAGISKTPLSIETIPRNGNNQIFCVICKDQNFILKKYFRHPEDNRDRLSAEYNFLKAASIFGLKQIPKVFARNSLHSAALYEYIEGTTIKTIDEISTTQIKQAATFISDLMEIRPELTHLKIKPASEACFSIQDHIDRVDYRLKELINVAKHGHESRDYVDIISQIATQWNLVKCNILELCAKNKNLDTLAVLSKSERILSPSDFGFHNVIIRPDTSPVFIDFEYAGWDDPAKLVGDFFAQVAIPIDASYLKLFTEIAFGKYENYATINSRIHLLLALYKIKWCCIVLNVFLPSHIARRKFANSNLDIKEIKHNQLSKASKILKEANI